MIAPPAGRPRAAATVLLPLALAALAGCGGAGPELAPVTGVVTYRGKPVSGAVVNFYREGRPRVASGRTDEQGRFKLTTDPDGDGAAVGENKAAVVMPVPPPAGPPAGGDDKWKATETHRKLVAAGSAQKTPFPDRYTRPDSSGFRFEVRAGQGNHFELAMKD